MICVKFFTIINNALYAREPDVRTPTEQRRNWDAIARNPYCQEGSTKADAKLFEVLFFKSGALRTEYWRVYFELHGEDLAILNDGKSLGLKTQTIVQSSGVLNLLPRDLDNGWNEFGRIVDDGNLESWVCGVEPTFGKNGRRIWVIEGTVKWSRLGLATFPKSGLA